MRVTLLGFGALCTWGLREPWRNVPRCASQPDLIINY
jgi:hypothetical protein